MTMDSDELRMLPTPTELSAPFWSGLADGRLRLPACGACGHRFFPPRPACPSCLRQDLTWVDTSGEGTVYSVTVVHRRPASGFDVPFALALVELDDGWTVMTHVVGCAPDDVRIGLRVRPTIQALTGRGGASLSLALFRPAD
jgi:hypothetical protein